MPYRIEYSLSAVEHLRALKAGQARAVLNSVDEQLQHQPAVETRNRRPMRPNPIAPSVGVKDRNVVRIGKEVFEP